MMFFFELASVSKQFTANVVMIVQKKRAARFDDPRRKNILKNTLHRSEVIETSSDS